MNRPVLFDGGLNSFHPKNQLKMKWLAEYDIDLIEPQPQIFPLHHGKYGLYVVLS